MIAIDLKIGAFEPEFVGKMNHYLGLLDDQVKMPDENPSIGIILSIVNLLLIHFIIFVYLIMLIMDLDIMRCTHCGSD